jgi:hypothetical protein
MFSPTHTLSVSAMHFAVALVALTIASTMVSAVVLPTCKKGLYYNGSACVPITVCSRPDEYALIAPTASSDRVCAARTCGGCVVDDGDDCSDASDLATCRSISGQRDVQSSSATALVAPQIKRADELGIQENENLALVSFPVLTHINGALNLEDDNALTYASFPALRVLADGDLDIQKNALLTAVNFPRLAYIADDLECEENAVLTSVLFPFLTTVVSDFVVQLNPSLTFIRVPRLTYIGGIIALCENNAAFTVPTGYPRAPAGGLVVSGDAKGASECPIAQGAGSCAAAVACP